MIPLFNILFLIFRMDVLKFRCWAMVFLLIKEYGIPLKDYGIP
ncbi:hypothetical protein SAMN05660226_04011 [Parapedobacter luteus]|uniref:Uncharacterized protein n=1 Tax=Parapedobacter luteus TaxID=623280 RepID=A0A1T5FIQ3_9SPHI|nr:hypothetical protein SAMN05660226_04011 [Parapedobacter luteus]